MLTSNFRELIEDQDNIRANLIDIRKTMKDDKQRKALAYELAGDFSAFTELLQHEDPKVRKNAVRILGDMECDDLCEAVWDAYRREETLFVKADYLKALTQIECRELLPQMKECLTSLISLEIKPEEEKHISEEISVLQKLILKYDGGKGHRFTGYDRSRDVILMVNRNHREATRSQIAEEDVKMMSSGIRVHTENLKDLLGIRTYSEILFCVPGMPLLEGTPEKIAKTVISARLTDFLDDDHSGSGPYCFRTDVRGIKDPDEKTAFIKKISRAVEKESGRRLVNSPSGYEIEMRFVAGKSGKYVLLIKLFTVPDTRFIYRKEVLPTSIAPVNAALIMELAGDYLREGAQVLDPFCGTGTMLIERFRKVPCSSVYGLDILEEAILKARRNTGLAHLNFNYINRNYFDFRHEYRFDEIVSNMPAAGRTRDQGAVRELYGRFLARSREILKDEAVLILCTTLPEILKQCLAGEEQYTIEQEHVLNERDGSTMMIVSYHGGEIK